MGFKSVQSHLNEVLLIMLQIHDCQARISSPSSRTFLFGCEEKEMFKGLVLINLSFNQTFIRGLQEVPIVFNENFGTN